MKQQIGLCPHATCSQVGKGPGLVPTNLSTHRHMATIPMVRGMGSWWLDTSGRPWARILICSLSVIKAMMEHNELDTGPSSSG